MCAKVCWPLMGSVSRLALIGAPTVEQHGLRDQRSFPFKHKNPQLLAIHGQAGQYRIPKPQLPSTLVLEARARKKRTPKNLPEKLVAYSYGLLPIHYGLLRGILACPFGPLGFPGSSWPSPKRTRSLSTKVLIKDPLSTSAL